MANVIICVWDVQVLLIRSIQRNLVPCIPNLPGFDQPNVYQTNDVLVGKYQLGNSALVIGGGMVGCETAEYALDYCEKVAIIEQLNLRAMIILSLQ